MKKFLTYCRNYIQKRYQDGIRIEKPPIFIVGCGHSGTSLLLAILGSHSKIYAIPQESKIAYKGWKHHLYLWRFNCDAIVHGKVRWVEKTPKHIRCIESILEKFPGAKIILIIRDGRDVACSYKARFGDLRYGIQSWLQDNLLGKPFWSNSSVQVIRYEDLIIDFEVTINNVLNFIGELFEPAMLDYHKQPKFYYSNNLEKPATESSDDHDQYRNWQINQPLFDGRGRWQDISNDEKQIIKEVANDLLMELGYIDTPDW